MGGYYFSIIIIYRIIWELVSVKIRKLFKMDGTEVCLETILTICSVNWENNKMKQTILFSEVFHDSTNINSFTIYSTPLNSEAPLNDANLISPIK